MRIKRKRFFVAFFTILSFLVVAIILNYKSLEYAKNACIDNNKTPKIEQGFLAFNWSVSCE
ncbi:hypothetical protein CVD25_14440 [Bacillus canaveralius]|uniref:Uncharacterized protein n=1 Tax=Bacillus canaveralius TaxID=1403243 RepID=A0A2N5GHT6_9BACI|nr:MULTISPECIES: hypothetical protein [Bacillus]PLR80360.1 hypothetical protein CU635_18795 [Bacillus canaveralius]PLR85833.1 hypothetical protein CVD23_07825 [Bacillus sp. V33-4]PLR95421.1 hypothetical protein CVD25_14440 [Bacillus canaveralius]